MVSPADETDTVPCDAQPEEIDVAVAIDRYQQIIDHPMQPPRIRGRGCGPSHLIAPLWLDQTRGSPVFWLAGQGGYGVRAHRRWQGWQHKWC